jgi:hypothetical protein
MKLLTFLLTTLLLYSGVTAQKHLFIITIDGVRWEEIYKGADPALIANEEYVRDTSLTREMYWDSTEILRRRRLLPFFWSTIAAKGCLLGNRDFGNKVNVRNFYKISYPGYNEIFTGHTDAFSSPNLAINNPNSNVLEYLNSTAAYHGKIAVFTSWRIFPFILNETRNGLPINSGYEKLNEAGDKEANLIDSVQSAVPLSNTRHDQLTYLSTREYIHQHHPSVVFMGLGQTDESAHQGRYDLYLQHIADADRMIAELWYSVQTDPYYKDSTTFIITTDHGRGYKPNKWTTHGFWAKGSGDIWVAILGPDIAPSGELKGRGQAYQKQLAATMAGVLGNPSGAGHPPGKPIVLPRPAMNDLAVKNWNTRPSGETTTRPEQMNAR